MKRTVLVTGAAGFIGSHVVDRLLSLGHSVVAVDNFTDYYNPEFKEQNIAVHSDHGDYTLYRDDITDMTAMQKIFDAHKIDVMIHLAAQAGVRSSIIDPIKFVDVNVRGTTILFELCQAKKVGQVIFASSSSVYGNQEKIPFSEDDSVTQPISPYAASKKSAELIAYTFHHLYGMHMTGLRFFTVYGERGRPDMSPYLFADAILHGKPLKQFGDGSTRRDYTYIEDVVNGVIAAMNHPLGFEIINLGNSRHISLQEYIELFEKITGKKAQIIREPEKLGDVQKTFADIRKARELLAWQPTTTIEEGLGQFIEWFKKHRYNPDR
jgi:UDP-glucuronate 4-epimerase